MDDTPQHIKTCITCTDAAGTLRCPVCSETDVARFFKHVGEDEKLPVANISTISLTTDLNNNNDKRHLCEDWIRAVFIGYNTAPDTRNKLRALLREGFC